jgi:adenosylhomocysteine nucleosidase
MRWLVISPLEEEWSCLAETLQAQDFTERPLSVGRLPVRVFPALGVTLAVGGHGKAQSALQTQYLIDQSDRVDVVVCAGAAGALAPDIAVGDLIIAETTIEHDYTLRFVQRPLPRFPGSQSLLSHLRSKRFALQPAQIHFGLIASGDEDIVEPERAINLRAQTGALAVAWEGAGVARACQFNNLPFLEIRGATDSADQHAPMDFETNLRVAMENLGKLLIQLALENPPVGT